MTSVLLRRMVQAALVAAPAAPLAAQGYGLYEQGACAMARAGAAVAAPCADGSTLVFNPAGIVGMPGTVALGATVIAPGGAFTNATTGRRSTLDQPPIVSPTLYAVAPLTRHVSAGLAVFSPYGLSLRWAPGSEGRFVGYRSELRVTHVQPTLAARLGALSIGAGLNLGIAHVRLQRRLDLAAQRTGIGTTTFGQLGVPAGTDFADVNLTADDLGLGWHAGALWRPTAAFALGARWLSRQVFRYDEGEAAIAQVPTGLSAAADIRNPATGAIVIPRGTPFDAVVAPQFAGAGPLVTQPARTTLVTPEQAVIGVAVRPTSALQLMVDVQWTNWRVFEDVRLEFARLPAETLEQRYRATWGYRAGAEYRLGERTMLRAGIATNEAAAPAQSVTPVLPEARRRAYTLGLGRQLTGRVAADLSYMYLDQSDRAGRSVAGGVAQNDGTFAFDAHLVGLTVTYRFAAPR